MSAILCSCGSPAAAPVEYSNSAGPQLIIPTMCDACTEAALQARHASQRSYSDDELAADLYRESQEICRYHADGAARELH